MLDATLYDGKHNLLPTGFGDSGQQDAPLGKHIVVKGLKSDFNVWVDPAAAPAGEKGDDTPLQFQYDQDSWNSDTGKPSGSDKHPPPSQRCSVGEYDTNHRDMDCWFNCA